MQIKYFRDCEAAFADNFKANVITGIMIGTGTDVVFHDRPITPIADEIIALANAGLGVLGAICAATQKSGAILRQSAIGEITPGKQADILLVEGNPVEDMSALKSVYRVYVCGELLYARFSQPVKN
jgi:imidazolonepropionase-like amidohydrolase